MKQVILVGFIATYFILAPEQKPTTWVDDVNNEANEEYVLECSEEFGVLPSEVTQKMFDSRYGETNEGGKFSSK